MPPPDVLYAGYLLLFGGAALTCFAGAYRARRVPRSDVRRGLQSLLLGSGGWALAHVGVLLPLPLALKSGFYEVGLVVGFSTVWAWLWFCSAYTGRSLHRIRTVQRFAAGVFAVVVLVKLTNPWHQLYYTLEPAGTAAPLLAVQHHILYWVVTGLSYALATAGYLMLLELFATSDADTRPLALLTGLTALPVALNLAGHASPIVPDLPHEPLGVAAFAVGVLFVYTYQFDSVPLTSGRDEPAIALRPDGRIGHCNREAVRLFPALGDRSAAGRPLRDVLPALASVLADDRPLFTADGRDPPRHYRVAQTRFGTGGLPSSRLIVLTDVTERERRERVLTRQRQKAEALYTEVSRLLRADDRAAVGASIRRLIHEGFGYPFVGVRFVRDGRLVPTHHSPAVFDRMPPRPPLRVEGESVIAEAYRRGDTRLIDDVEAADAPTDYGDVRGAAFIPMAQHGTISIGTRDPGTLDDFDRRLIEVLAASAAAVLDRLDHERDLVEAKATAERMDRLKSAFLANTSHEIRTPLTSIIGFAETIQEETASPETDGSPVPRFARLIAKSGTRLLETLDDILALSRLEAEEMDLSPHALDLDEEVRAIADEFRAKARDADVHLDVASAGALPGRGNRAAVQVVLRNLLSNAIKYTEPGGRVRVRARWADDAAVLEVADTGIGMDPDRVEALFEPFQQASEGLGRRYEGVGLGLAITRRVAEQMGGAVSVETQEGEGTRVTVRLPVAEETPAADPPASYVRSSAQPVS